MKTIGLLGGMSWESSSTYYRVINEETRRRLGGLHSARSVMYSVDFAEIEALQAAGRWDRAGQRLAAAAEALQAAGADFIVICTNTMHKLAGDVQRAAGVPLLHIADATAARVAAAGVRTVGLLGTRFTMEEDFYRGRLEREFGLTVLVPGDDARRTVDRVIFEELCVGRLRPASRQAYRDIIAGLTQRGAQGVILGCTEIGLLIGPQDAPVPLFDTALIHAEAAVDYALAP